MAASEKAIVIDIGSFSTKINLAGEQKPEEERTVSVKQINEQKESTESTIYYGTNGIDEIKKTANSKDKGKKPTNILDTDMLSNIYNESDDSEIGGFLQSIIIKNIFNGNDNEGKLSNHPLLLTDHINSNKKYRTILSEILFEQLSIPSLYFEVGGVLGLYASGRKDGLMIDMGYSQTSIIPIVNGYCMDHAARKINFGGKQFDQYFNNLLRKSGITLHTNYQLEIVRQIKEEKAECKLETAYEKLQDDEEINCAKYEMPDGTILQIGNARYRSSEVLFGPHLIGEQCKGIQFEILECINDCDLALRKNLMSNITLIGGTSLLKGFGRRLVNELVLSDYNRYNYQLLIAKNSKDGGYTKDTTDKPIIGSYGKDSSSIVNTNIQSSKPQKINKKTGIRMYAPKNRNYSAWIGGSVLAAMDGFNDMLISKKQYEEEGKNILYRTL